jgi:hypothetical protein
MVQRVVLSSALFVITMGAMATYGRQQPKQSAGALPIDEIIHKFAAAESRNRNARNVYTYTQDFDIKTLGIGGFITGEFHRVSEIVYDDRGKRFEKITFFPQPTLTEISMTQEDMDDLAGVQPFALTLEDLSKYQVDYVGKERIDELQTYTFDIKPRQLVKGQRYFQGRIWVDDQDLQIVKAAGKGVPDDGDHQYPHFESFRENIDGKYWFPTYVYADDELNFKRSSVHVKMVVHYKSYKKFQGNIKVVDDDSSTPDDANQNPDSKKPENKNPPPIPKKP